MLLWLSIRVAWRRYRVRQRIAKFDRHLLKDIGVGFAEAGAESNKPFWQKLSGPFSTTWQVVATYRTGCSHTPAAQDRKLPWGRS